MSDLCFPFSPLSLDSLTRDYWGSVDAAAIAQIAPLSEDECYQPKLYRAPALSNELLLANGYASYGMKVTPGAILYGIYLPVNPFTGLPGAFSVQITDQSLKRKLFSQPIASYFLANNKPAFLTSIGELLQACFPYLFTCPYPVCGTGLFLVEIWETSGNPQRVELVVGAFEPVGGCL